MNQSLTLNHLYQSKKRRPITLPVARIVKIRAFGKLKLNNFISFILHYPSSSMNFKFFLSIISPMEGKIVSSFGAASTLLLTILGKIFFPCMVLFYNIISNDLFFHLKSHLLTMVWKSNQNKCFRLCHFEGCDRMMKYIQTTKIYPFIFRLICAIAFLNQLF